MPAPDRRDAESHWQVAVTVLHHVHQREVVLHKRHCQGHERGQQPQGLQVDGGPVQAGGCLRQQARHALAQRRYQRQHQRKMTQLADHGLALSAGVAGCAPLSSSAFFTSGGM